MKYKILFNTDINSSLVSLGAVGFGQEIPYHQMDDILQCYLDLGGNMLDTARIYGNGISEETLGKWILKSGRRNCFYLSTKCAHPIRGTFKARLSRDEIFSDVEKSLNALNTDVIDILWLHRDDATVPVEEIIDALNELVKQGKVRYLGASNWTGERIAMANAYAEKCGKLGFCASQIQFSIAKVNPMPNADSTLLCMDEKEYEFYNRTGISVFAYSSQAKGYFTKMNTDMELKDSVIKKFENDQNIELLAKIRKVAMDCHISVSDVVLSYVTSQKHFASVAIVGCKSVNQLRNSLQNADFELSNDQLNYLSKFTL